MSRPDLARSSAVFEACLAAPEGERERVLAEICGADSALRDEVCSLLEHHRRSAGFLAAPVLLTELDGDLVLRALGRYRILARLGAGGMGVVYLAEQDNPRRKVALKVLRPGTAGTAERFAREAELLGRLQHPGIAQIHEAVAGDPATGAPPYFAMEYVEGRTLTEHASARGPGLRERLELLIAVCEAVQHAHQKGVVHRDLKPANLLVDSAGRPKVLDFGVARAIGADLGTAHATHAGEIVGTLAYMSPEQAAGDPERLDTRADIYALGVVAYELLAGRLPFDLAGASLTEAVRRVREDEPPLLGTLRRELAGDLETIVAKAMAKEPARRYASASELAQDLRRYLADEPILARPPSTLYQLRKFARRNAKLVASAAAFLLLLVGGSAVIAWLALRLAEQRDEALGAKSAAERERSVAQAARDEADQHRRTAVEEAAAAQAVSTFLEDVLSAAEPYVAGRDTTVADAVRWAEEHVDERFADRPDLAAALRRRLASIHWSRGELDPALAASQAARAQFETSAEEDPLSFAASLTTEGTLLETRGELEAAERKLRAAVELFERHAAPDDAGLLTALTSLSAVLFGRGAYDEAEPMMRAVLERRTRVHGPEHPYTLTARNNLANLLLDTGRAAEAEPELRAIMETSRRVLTTRHPNTIQAIYNYADTLRTLGRAAEAEPLFREAIELDRTHLPVGHWFIGLHRSRYGELLLALERPLEAEPELLAGCHVLEAALGLEHARTQRAVRSLVSLYETLEDPAGAAEWRARLRGPER